MNRPAIHETVLRLGAKLESRCPALWAHRFRLAGFLSMFLVFFIINRQILLLPETLLGALNASPLAHIAYSDAAVRLFPPALEIKDVILGGQALRGAVFRYDTLTVRPLFRRLFTGKAGVRVTALAGKGSATLEAATGGGFDFSRTAFTVHMDNMPLRVLEALERFDPDVDGAVNASLAGEVSWITAAGTLIPRDCDMAADGRITLVSARNGLAALTFERFRNGVFHFDLSVAGRLATIHRMDFTDDSCGVTVKGKAVVDWRNVADSELNLTAEAKAGPEFVTPALMTGELRQRLEQGRSLPFLLQGTLSNVQMKPAL